jgi:hypothetical protein
VGTRSAIALRALTVAALAGCAPTFDHAIDLRYATARAARQTDPATVAVIESEPDRPYHVLGDLQVRGFQVGSLGEAPSPATVTAALREQAARLGADAVILLRFGGPGLGAVSIRELEARGRAVRF